MNCTLIIKVDSPEELKSILNKLADHNIESPEPEEENPGFVPVLEETEPMNVGPDEIITEPKVPVGTFTPKEHDISNEEKLTCQWCKKEFTSKKANKKFCSDKCYMGEYWSIRIKDKETGKIRLLTEEELVRRHAGKSEKHETVGKQTAFPAELATFEGQDPKAVRDQRLRESLEKIRNDKNIPKPILRPDGVRTLES